MDSKIEKLVVLALTANKQELQERIYATLLMMRSFSILLGASRGFVAFRDPTALSKFIERCDGNLYVIVAFFVKKYSGC